MVDKKYFSTNEDEEEVLDYKPSIQYIPKELKTIDNTKARPTNETIDFTTSSGISKKYLNASITDLIADLKEKILIMESLRSDMSEYLSGLNFSININTQLPAFYNDIINNGNISFKDYQSIPNTEEYRIIHDIWLKGAVSMNGNIVAETYPILSDMLDDTNRISSLVNDVLLYGTSLNMDSDNSDFQTYILDKVSTYENMSGRILENQRENKMNIVQQIIKEQKTIENELKIDTEITSLLKCATSMIDIPLKIIGINCYSEIDGENRDNAQKELASFVEKTQVSSKNLQVPMLYGYKNIANSIIKDRLISSNQYSTEVKEANNTKILQLGRSWKNICIPDIANYLTIGYNSDNILYYLSNGIVEINTQLINSLKDFYKISIGEMNIRTKIEKEMAYKNNIRHIYNSHLNGGT